MKFVWERVKKGKCWSLISFTHLSHLFSWLSQEPISNHSLNFFVIQHPCIWLLQSFFSNVSFLLFPPSYNSLSFSYFFLFAIPNFHHQSPNCWMQISIWKNIISFYIMILIIGFTYPLLKWLFLLLLYNLCLFLFFTRFNRLWAFLPQFLPLSQHWESLVPQNASASPKVQM